MKKEKNTIFIFGGSYGIGFSVAKELNNDYNSIAIFSRNEDNLINAKKELEQFSNHARIKTFQVDAIDFGSLKNSFSDAVSSLGSPNLVMNFIGIARPDYFENISNQTFTNHLLHNLLPVWNISKLAVDSMKLNGGHLVHTSSIVGIIGVFGYTNYSMAKFGIIGFCEALSQEVNSYGIKVHVLCPPDTDTPGFIMENESKPIETKIISGKVKLKKPEEVAQSLLKGIRKNKFLIFCGIDSRLQWKMKRYMPNILTQVIFRTLLKAKTAPKSK